MTKHVFFSFYYADDVWRAAQVRNIGGIEGNNSVNDNGWEAIAKGGRLAIQKWIDDEMRGKDAVAVLIGENTAGRPWINYEIRKAWQEQKGLLGICVHDLKDQNGSTSRRGRNPFGDFIVEDGKLTARTPLSVFTSSGTPLEDVVPVYETPFWAFSSRDVYANIRDNIAHWIDGAIDIRRNYDYEHSVF